MSVEYIGIDPKNLVIKEFSAVYFDGKRQYIPGLYKEDNTHAEFYSIGENKKTGEPVKLKFEVFNRDVKNGKMTTVSDEEFNKMTCKYDFLIDTDIDFNRYGYKNASLQFDFNEEYGSLRIMLFENDHYEKCITIDIPSEFNLRMKE